MQYIRTDQNIEFSFTKNVQCAIAAAVLGQLSKETFVQLDYFPMKTLVQGRTLSKVYIKVSKVYTLF